jgi:nitroreductase
MVSSIPETCPSFTRASPMAMRLRAMLQSLCQ